MVSIIVKNDNMKLLSSVAFYILNTYSILKYTFIMKSLN